MEEAIATANEMAVKIQSAFKRKVALKDYEVKLQRKEVQVLSYSK